MGLKWSRLENKKKEAKKHTKLLKKWPEKHRFGGNSVAAFIQHVAVIPDVVDL